MSVHYCILKVERTKRDGKRCRGVPRIFPRGGRKTFISNIFAHHMFFFPHIPPTIPLPPFLFYHKTNVIFGIRLLYYERMYIFHKYSELIFRHKSISAGRFQNLIVFYNIIFNDYLRMLFRRQRWKNHSDCIEYQTAKAIIPG